MKCYEFGFEGDDFPAEKKKHKTKKMGLTASSNFHIIYRF